jgi:hypothetical protein
LGCRGDPPGRARFLIFPGILRKDMVLLGEGMGVRVFSSF